MPYLWLTVLLLLLAFGWLLTLIGLPGTWLMVAAAAAFAWFVGADGPFALGWYTVAGLLLLAAAGEAVEFFAGVYGAGRLGASRRAMTLSMLASIAGGLIGAVVGLPVPLIGSLLGAVLFGAIGAWVGALVGELWRGRTLHVSWSIGHGAFWGRVWGTLLKSAIATVMLLLAIVAAVF